MENIKKQKFNKEDLEIYHKFINQLPKQNKSENQNVWELPFEQQIFLVKEYIDKYYMRQENQNYTLEDYIQVCLIGLNEAIQNFKGKYHYERHVERYIEKEIKENFQEENTYEEYNEKDINDLDPYEIVIQKYVHDLVIEEIGKLPETMKKTIMYKYGFLDSTNYTQKEIGEICHKSTTSIMNTNRKALEKLRLKLLIRRFAEKDYESYVYDMEHYHRIHKLEKR